MSAICIDMLAKVFKEHSANSNAVVFQEFMLHF